MSNPVNDQIIDQIIDEVASLDKWGDESIKHSESIKVSAFRWSF